jgi:hypothetical protein
MENDKSREMEAEIRKIDAIVDKLDKGLMDSEKVQAYLRKHCQY